MGEKSKIQSDATGVDLLQRASDLVEKAGMPWADAERLALSEIGIGDAEIAELKGECISSTTITGDEIQEYTRAVLVHGCRLVKHAEIALLQAEIDSSPTPDDWIRLTEERDSARALAARNREALDAQGKLIDSMNLYLRVMGAGNAARAVIDERQRQISVEGWTPEHDDKYTAGDMSTAAAVYAMQGRYHFPEQGKPGPLWPWPVEWWKPSTYRRNLEKAGALILAEIERLDRADTQAKP